MKNFRTYAAALTAAVLVLTGCSIGAETELDSITQNSERVSPEVLLHRAHSQLEEPIRGSVVGEPEWREFLEEALPQEREAFTDTVDFSRSFVAVAGLGIRPTGGFNVAIPDAYVRDDSMFVLIRHTLPGRDCVVPQVQTSPVEAVVLPRKAENIRFVVEEQTLACE